eukprot:gene13210-15520_t
MKLYKTVFLLFLVTVLGAGCKKSFLDDPKPTDKIAASVVFKDEAGVKAYFNGIYRRMREQWSNNNVASSTDCWGISSLYLARENKGDAVINDGGWYQFDYAYDNRDATFRRVVFVWGFLYEFVNHANVIIDGVTNGTMTQDLKDKYIGQAKALRAWAYFELIREFQFSYAKSSTAPGVPIYTDPTTTARVGKPRGTVADVYTLIVSDLTFAVAKLKPHSQENKSNIDMNVAAGLLARVYLEMGKWKDAENSATTALTGYSLNAGDYKTSINIVDNAENIWAFGQQADQSIYYGTPSSFWDKTGTGYDNFFINDNLVTTFSQTDVRNKFVQYDNSGPEMWGTNKFGGVTNFTEAIVMIRAAEMVLIQAEAKAMLGEPDAASTLFSLQQNRDPQAVASGNTGDALINEILLERKKELYGENGAEFMDLKRRNLPLIRTGNHAAVSKFNVAANDKRFVLQIPQGEFDSNKALTAADQNP